MASANVVTLLGNVTLDPELKYTPQQTAVADFGLAVDHKWTDSAGQAQEDTMFITVRTWGKLAEVSAKYLTKGRLVLVIGRLDLDTWDKDGETRRQHFITASNVQWMPNKKRDREPGQEG